MTTVNYPSPVMVNGYSCKNCTDVDYAKRNIDPQHPKDGPFGVNKAQNAAAAGGAHGPAVVIDGRLVTAANGADKSADSSSATQGAKVDLRV